MTPARARRKSLVLASEEELFGAKPARQVRSLDAMLRISDAARRLFAERGYEAVAVAEIANAAGMSVGAFYTRFESKEHLVIHLLRDLSAEMRAEMDARMDPAILVGADLRTVVRRYLEVMARAFSLHREILRPASLIARQTQDEGLRALLRQFNLSVHGQFRRLLEQRVRMHGRTTTTRIDVAILTMSAAMREVFLYGEPVSSLVHDHDELLTELTRSTVLYLESNHDAV